MDTNVYAVEASTGNLVWSQKTNGAIYSSSAVADGVVYIGSWDGYVYAFDAANGSPIWNYNTGGQVFSAPTVAGGVMFVGSYNSKVFAFGISYSPTSSAPPSPISSSMPLPSAKDVTNTVWVPPVANGAVTPIVTVGVIAIVAALASILSSAPASASKGFFQILADKIRGIVPDVVKKWFEDFIASKRKLRIDEKQGSPYLPTKSEAIVYALSVIISTISFAYVKVINLNQFLIILPTFFVTSILVSLVRTYLLSLYARRKGVWTEYKLWYFGVGLFLITTFALKAPFSSPTRAVHHSHNFTEKLAGVLSFASVLITLGFGALFFVILKGGFILIGGTGLAMCIISSFFDTFPIEPMGGKDIYKYHKAVWAGLFFTTLALYIVWLAQIL
jgi:hypothetical protein